MKSEENDSLSRILLLLFQKVSSKDIMDGRLFYNHFDKKTFFNLASCYLENYTGSEIQNLYNYLVNEIRNINGKREAEMEDSFSILDVLHIFNQKVLTELEAEPVCRYDHLLKWRKVSFELEEDLFTTSYLAKLDIRRGWGGRSKFDWKCVVGNDNEVLKSVLNKGLAENHFHLKGSAPYFIMSWINLMNLVNHAKFSAVLAKYDQERRNYDMMYHSDSAEPPLVHQHLQAAAIRAFLFTILTGKEFIMNEYYELPVEAVWEWLNLKILHEWDGCGFSGQALRFVESVEKELHLEPGDIVKEGKKKKLPYDYVCGLLKQARYLHINTDVIRHMVKPEERKEFTRKVVYNRLCEILGQEQDLMLFRDNLSQQIKEFRIDENGQYDKNSFDYMLRACTEQGIHADLLGGERYFLYCMFKGLYQGDPNLTPYGNLFYAYLVIKERIRSELIQVNRKVGFDNFLRYQNRKEEFIDDTALEKVYSRYSVRSTLESQPVVKLEARITPRNTARENKDYINKLDKGIGITSRGELRKKVFYVFHFVKEPEKPEEVKEDYYRHYRLRRKAARQAIAIEAFRERYPKEASRVYGIDACSPEIGCRPEVFAQAYRYLKADQNRETILPEGYDSDYRLPRLGCTYHVGEDFLDIVDGMRAIDEAIYFLNLSHGDRLGHALAAGLPPKDWYCFKHNRVLNNKQDKLDNIVWVYEKIRKYNIPDTQNLLLNLERQFTHCFQDIYGSELDKEIDIHVYYDAWKLRGDNPEYYIGGEYAGLPDEEILTEWEYCAVNRLHEELDKIRQEKKCTRLYSLYHYNENVKRRGKEIVESKIDYELIHVVAQIQECMQRELVEKGLCIETNPSSNVLISTFGRYDRHPVVTWFNKGLTNDPELLNKCPQIDVTINTDDQAVFGTSLENEYALMAIAMEKVKDENGKPVYNINMIYDWLDHIREQGIIRCFNQDKENGGRSMLKEPAAEAEEGEEEAEEWKELLAVPELREYLLEKLREVSYAD